jgi:hypothetical protein
MLVRISHTNPAIQPPPPDLGLNGWNADEE